MKIQAQLSLSKKERRVLADYAYGEISQAQAAKLLNITRQHVDRYLGFMLKQAVAKGRINVADVLIN